jgi:Ti-type conjugative transfer relaxase TraA
LINHQSTNGSSSKVAIYHLSVKVISRAGGRSALAAAAYRSASELHDERLNQTHDYTQKAGVVHSEILLPTGAPQQLLDRATLWNTVEAGERRKDAQLAREVEFSLPRELAQPAAIRLAQDFVREQFVTRGMVADLNVHWSQTADGELQPHAHVMLTMRAVGPEGFGPKVRDWNRTEVLVGWRERWAELANERLIELGHDIRIDHRSYAAQGIGLEPQNKIGPAGARREARGEEAERAAEHEALARRNGERIILDPTLVLEALTRQQSTFTRRDLARVVARHTADADQFATAMAKVEASPEVVRLGLDEREQERFTTREMLATEQRMEQTAVTLAERPAHRVHLRRRLAESTTLGGEQVLAFRHVTQTRDLSVVVGYAGTGKSTMLGEARVAWEAEGYQVRGAALSGIAAEQLEAGAGISSRTVHSLLFQWEQGKEALSNRDVLVVDEAGMIGSRQMERLLAHVQAAGAKAVLVGDPEQLQAIEAGAAFRAIAERVGAVEITEVRRQREDWQQAATRSLATGGTATALARYEDAGMVQRHVTLDAAKAAVIAGWDAVRQEAPETRQIMLAYRRVDVRDLNLRARAVRQAVGELGEDHQVQTERGPRDFAVGDRVYFLRNERGLGVKNGTLGTLQRIEGSVAGQAERLTVRLDDGRAVGFDLKDYAHIDHGYAATVHKSQGVTVDRTHVLASRSMDRHATYVGLSRHRDRVDLHWSLDELGSREGLTRVLGRERLKDTSLDYPLAPARARTAKQPGIRPDSSEQMRPDSSQSVRAYGARRGVSMPESEIVVAAAAQEPALAQRITAGRAGFRERYAAHQQQREQAQALVSRWDQRIEAYRAALPGLGRDDATLDQAREQLLAVGRELRERPDLAAVLRERGEAFGMAQRPNFQRVVADAQPERVIARMVKRSEHEMRVEQVRQVERERVQQEQQRLQAQQRLAHRQRGPSMRM